MNDFAQTLRHMVEQNKGGLNELYRTVSMAAMEMVTPAWHATPHGKRACYFSAEFLLGRMIYANLYNLGLLEDLRTVFAERGLDPNLFEEVDDAALGNGGLGRLAACFLDSAATGGYALDGYGIRYSYGLFRQYFQEGFQREVPDDWLRFGDPWSVRREDQRVRVVFKDQSVWAVPYDMPVIGYGLGTPGGKAVVNTLRLWQAEPADAIDLDAFNKQDYPDAFKRKNEAEAITSVLYPNDDTRAGKLLRLKQQYFFSAASLQSILIAYKAQYGNDFTNFPECYAIQLNDTHPTIAIPELLRLLVEGEGMLFEDAFAIACKTFAYTNHTIMAEALEKWDVGLFVDVAPQVYPYVVMLQNHLRRELAQKGLPLAECEQYDIVANGQVHMARMAIYAGHSINGVAALHTEILMKDALKEWYALYPQRFNNKTNGITQRRWLGLCNPELAAFITDRIGPDWVTDLDELEKLTPYENDTQSLRQLIAIKHTKKEQLAAYVQAHEAGTKLRTDAVFDIQIKRLHEYKRQFLNALSIMDIYFRLKDGELKGLQPITFLFGAKAAPGYYRAKGIIKFINEIARKLNSDPDTCDVLQVLFVQNYNVSYAEKLIPAADISEQISIAGTEASGTGNMKLMLNGAVTLGTYDGANVEIVQQAGEENNYIFGARVADIAKVADNYDPMQIYQNNPRVRRVLDTLVDGTFHDGRTGMFRELYDAILVGASWHKPDHYYLLLDFEPYVEAKLRAVRDYTDELGFARKCLCNITGAGKFSSDRTIRQYSQEIWGL